MGFLDEPNEIKIRYTIEKQYPDGHWGNNIDSKLFTIGNHFHKLEEAIKQAKLAKARRARVGDHIKLRIVRITFESIYEL